MSGFEAFTKGNPWSTPAAAPQTSGGSGGGGFLDGPSTFKPTNSIFGGTGLGGASTATPAASNDASTTPAKPPPAFGGTTFGGGAFGGGTFGGGAFGAAKPAGTSAFGGNSAFGGGGGASAFGGSAFGGGAATTPTVPSTPAPAASSSNTGSFNSAAWGTSAFGGGGSTTPAATPGPGQKTNAFGQVVDTGNSGSAPSTTNIIGGSKAPEPVDSAPKVNIFGMPMGATLAGFAAAANKDKDKESAPAPSTDASAAKPPSMFGSAASAPANSAFSMFGAKPPTSSTPATNSNPADTTTKPSLFGGTSTPAAPAPSATPNLFDMFKDKSKDTPAAAPSIENKPAETKPGLGGFGSAPPLSSGTTTSTLFGAPAPSATTTTAPAGNTPSTATTTAPATTSTTPAAAPASGPLPSVLRGKTIDEIVSKWDSELTLQTREFGRMANEVAVWDRILMENSEKINVLYNKVTTAHATQASVDESLKHIEDQQKSLNSTLGEYEEVTKQILNSAGRALDLGPADRERDNNYGLATTLNTQLDDLSQSLASMIDSVNTLSSMGQDSSSTSNLTEDPIIQIEAILNAHLGSLQWIDGAVRELEVKVKDVEEQIGGDFGGGSMGSSMYSEAPQPRRGFGLGPSRR